MFGAAMPSKTYNIMAAGKPVLALTDENSESPRVLDESGIGWRLAPGNIDLLEATLVKIHSQKDELECLGRKARQVAEKQYSAAIAIEHYRLALS